MRGLKLAIVTSLTASVCLGSPISPGDEAPSEHSLQVARSLTHPLASSAVAERSLDADLADALEARATSTPADPDSDPPDDDPGSDDDGSDDGSDDGDDSDDDDDGGSGTSRRLSNNKYGSGIINNTANQKRIQKASKKLVGQYYIKNVHTGGYLYWQTNPQTIIPSTTKKGKMTLRTFGVGTQIEPTSSNNKCLAAQWNSSRGVDWAGTPYACVSPSYKETGPLGDTKVKQQWHLLPVPGKKNQYNLIPENHLSNMRTRALSSGRLTTAGGYHSTAIDTFNANDPNQRWLVVSA